MGTSSLLRLLLFAIRRQASADALREMKVTFSQAAFWGDSHGAIEVSDSNAAAADWRHVRPRLVSVPAGTLDRVAAMQPGPGANPFPMLNACHTDVCVPGNAARAQTG